MKSALTIFNGIKFPYNLMEFVLTQVKQERRPVHALFLKVQKEASEGYVFPSDIKQAEETVDIKMGCSAAKVKPRILAIVAAICF